MDSVEEMGQRSEGSSRTVTPRRVSVTRCDDWLRLAGKGEARERSVAHLDAGGQGNGAVEASEA